MKIALVSCTKLKASYPCTAREMYKSSPLFSKAVKYINQQKYDNWYVLSAKYGLLCQDDVIEPYDLTLTNMKSSERKEWSKSVLNQLINKNLNLTQVDFYTGTKYREYVIPLLERQGIKCNVPLLGKGIGQQLQFYSSKFK